MQPSAERHVYSDMWNVRSAVRGSSWLVASALTVAIATVITVYHERPHTKRIDPNDSFVRESTRDLREKLADLYMSQNNLAAASAIYQELMTTSPSSNHVCLWQYNVAHARYWMTGASDATVTEIENLVRLSRKNLLPTELRTECHDNAAGIAGDLARAFHTEAAKTRSVETLGYSERLYKSYLEAFPDAADWAQTQYFYAELLWSRAETVARTQAWQDTATAFTEVVKTGRVDAKLMRESAYAAVLGWNNALDVTPDPQPITKTRDVLPIPDTTRKLLAAIDAYIAVIHDANDDDVIGVKFIAANTYRHYNHFAEAIALCHDILADHLEHENAEYAATLLVGMLDALGRYDEMDATIDALVANPVFLGGKSDPWLVALRDAGLLDHFR